MFRSVLVGTDGSPSAQRALNRGIELSRLSGAKLHLVMAYRDSTYAAALLASDPLAGGTLAHVSGDAAKETAEHVLQLARKEADGLEVETHAVPGEAAAVLLDVAEAVKAECIIVGNRGMQGARRFLGSVPNHVAHHAPCTVMIVHTT